MRRAGRCAHIVRQLLACVRCAARCYGRHCARKPNAGDGGLELVRIASLFKLLLCFRTKICTYLCVPARICIQYYTYICSICYPHSHDTQSSSMMQVMHINRVMSDDGHVCRSHPASRNVRIFASAYTTHHSFASSSCSLLLRSCRTKRPKTCGTRKAVPFPSACCLLQKEQRGE
jgi:hypothetical protein